MSHYHYQLTEKSGGVGTPVEFWHKYFKHGLMATVLAHVEKRRDDEMDYCRQLYADWKRYNPLHDTVLILHEGCLYEVSYNKAKGRCEVNREQLLRMVSD